MSMKLGTISLNAVYLGTTSIAALYLGAAQVFGGGAVEFDPASLFASGEEGAWYEPSTTTAFTDTGGSVAATYGDPVAYLQDLSGNGNHATQTTLASRPILARVPEGGRRNLLERTEEFDDAAWVHDAIVTLTAETSPVITTGSVYKLTENNSNVVHDLRQVSNSALVTSATWTASLYIKDAGDNRFIQIRPSGVGLDTAYATFDPTDGSLTQSGGSALVGTPAAISVGNGWYRVEMTCSEDLIDISDGLSILLTSSGTAVENQRYAGDGISGVYIWGAQFEVGTSSTDYQKVVDEYDITESGVTSLEYLSFDGVDDYLSVGSNQITGSQDRTVFAALEIDSVGGINSFFDMGAEATGARYSHSAGYNSADIGIGISGSNTYWGSSPDTSQHVYVTVLEGDQLVDVSARKDGVTLSVNSSASPTNVINTSSSNTTIGVDVGLANFLNGNLYGLLVRGASSTTDEITNTEAYLATRSGVTL